MPLAPKLPETKAEPLWDELWSWMAREFPRGDVPVIVAEWPAMYAQAILAYDAGAIELAAVGCRSAVESIGYTFEKWFPSAPFSWTRRSLVSPERMSVARLKQHLERLGPIPEAISRALDHIRFDGDAGAHLSERIDQEFDAVTKHQARRAGAPTGTDARTGLARVWTDETDVIRDLRETLLVFKAVILAAKTERDAAA